jgi:hypothetical protein
MNSKTPNSTTSLSAVENNIIGVSISPAQQTSSWGPSGNAVFKDKKYYCSTTNVAYPIFESIESSIKFIGDRWKGRLGEYSKTKESITKFLVKNNNASTQRNDDVYNKLSNEEKGKLEKIVQDAIDAFNQTPK